MYYCIISHTSNGNPTFAHPVYTHIHDCTFVPDLIVFPADLDSSPAGSLSQWMLTQGQFTHSLWAGVSSLK